MRRVERHSGFKKSYKKRIAGNPKLVAQFEEKTSLFINGVSGYPIYDHPLTGKLAGKRSFTVSSDCRVVYKVVDGVCVFIDVGSHNQVYK